MRQYRHPQASLWALITTSIAVSLCCVGFAPAARASSSYTFVRGWDVHSDSGGFTGECLGLAVHNTGRVYVADRGDSCIQKFTATGTYLIQWGQPAGSADGHLNWPIDVAVDTAGNVYVMEQYNYRVQKFTSEGAFLAKWGTEGTGQGQFADPPEGIGLDTAGNVYVADQANHRIQKFSSNGTFIAMWGIEGHGQGGAQPEFYYPCDVAVDSAGYIYVCDPGNHRIQKLTSTGDFVAQWGNAEDPDFEPSRIAIDAAGAIYVTDQSSCTVRKFTSSGQLITWFDGSGSGEQRFGQPAGIAVDSAGYVYVSDRFAPAARSIRVFRPASQHAPTAPTSVTIAPTSPGPEKLTATATGSTDANGDSLTYKYQWSKKIGTTWSAWGYTGRTLAASNVAIGDIWRVRAQALDGTSGSPWKTGSSVTIVSMAGVIPAPKTYNVPVTTCVFASFRWPVQQATVTGRVQLKLGTTKVIPTVMTWVTAEKKIKLRPKSPLLPNTYYRINIDPGITCTSGRVLGWGENYWFKTAPATTTAAVTVAAAPTAGGAELTVNLTSAATVRTVISNIAGRPVAELPERDLPAGVSSLLWNGKSNGGSKAPAGTYLVRVVATGSEGTQATAIAPLQVR